MGRCLLDDYQVIHIAYIFLHTLHFYSDSFQEIRIMELRHWGILLIILGTGFLAFSVKTRTKYDNDQQLKEALRRSEKYDSWVEPNKTWIDKRLFWTGLICVAVGSLLQW
jgi:hypothetical protein